MLTLRVLDLAWQGECSLESVLKVALEEVAHHITEPRITALILQDFLSELAVKLARSGDRKEVAA